MFYMKLNSFYEVLPIIKRKSKIDTLIIRNEIFKEKIEKNQNIINIPPNIQIINIDYYFGSDLNKVRKKTLRGYQGNNKLLLIVLLSTNKKIKVPVNVPYEKNIRILTYSEFAKFIKLRGTFLDRYNTAIEIARNYCDAKLQERLRQMSVIAKTDIQENFPNQQERFEEYVINNNLSNLLYSTPKDQGLLKYLP